MPDAARARAGEHLTRLKTAWSISQRIAYIKRSWGLSDPPNVAQDLRDLAPPDREPAAIIVRISMARVGPSTCLGRLIFVFPLFDPRLSSQQKLTSSANWDRRPLALVPCPALDEFLTYVGSLMGEAMLRAAGRACDPNQNRMARSWLDTPGRSADVYAAEEPPLVTFNDFGCAGMASERCSLVLPRRRGHILADAAPDRRPVDPLSDALMSRTCCGHRLSLARSPIPPKSGCALSAVFDSAPSFSS